MLTSFPLVSVSPPSHIDTTCRSPDTARVAVNGEIDLATAEILRDRLLNVLGEHPPAVVNVDLSGVTFLDCTGVGALLAGYDAAIQVGCPMWVTGPRPIMHRILDPTGPLGILTAPIDQVRGRVVDPEHPSGVEVVRNPMPQHPEWLAAA